jgi:hypothetical protein
VTEASTVAVTGREVGVIVGAIALVDVGVEVAVGDVSTEAGVEVEVGTGVRVDVGAEAGAVVEVGEADVSAPSVGFPVAGNAVSSTNCTRVDVGGMGVGVGVVARGVTGVGTVVGAEVIAAGGKKAYRANQARPHQTTNHRTMPRAKAATRPAEL